MRRFRWGAFDSWVDSIGSGTLIEVDPSFGTELGKQGPLGFVCLLLVAAIVALWRTIVADRASAAAALKAEREAAAAVLKAEREAYAATLKEANATILILQESRLQDGKKTTEVLTNTASVMANQTGAIRDLEDSLRGMLAEAQARRGQR